MTPEDLAKLFHETYEELAPQFGYKTREASAVPWEDVPTNNKSLMIAVAAHVLSVMGDQPVVALFECGSCQGKGKITRYSVAGGGRIGCRTWLEACIRCKGTGYDS